MTLLGPLPADTMFSPPVLARGDCVLAMYHDQGLTALKYASFGQGINVTLGLPIIRTSVDHGTALELAGSGRGRSRQPVRGHRAGHRDGRAWVAAGGKAERMRPHVARKRFGQHFLVDQQVIADIVDLLAVQRDETVVEIGPGWAP
jgi:hypothetical protein